MIYSSKDMESRAVLDTAAKICAAARTAPKTRGMDGLVTCVLTGEDKSQLAAQMRKLADELDYAFFNRDADNVDASDAVVLFGMEEVRRGLDAGCQYCHFESCADCTEKDGLCAWDAIDIGIAIGAGTDIAIDSADIVLMHSDPADIPAALQLSRSVLRNIKQNLFWAFLYNSIGIPIAAGVFYSLLGWKLSPMLASAAFNVTSIVLGLLIGWFIDPSFGPKALYGFACGVTLGGMAQIAVQLPKLRRTGFRWKPNFQWNDPKIKKIWGLMLPSVLASGVTQFTIFINTGFALNLQKGSVTALTTAFRLWQLPVGLFGVATGMVVLPAVSRMMVGNGRKEVAAHIAKGLRLVAFFAVPAFLILYILGTEFVSSVYQWGRFNQDAVRYTGEVLGAYSLGLLGYAGTKVVQPVFLALEKRWVPLIAAAVALAISIGLNYYFVYVLHKNAAWLAFTTSVVTTFNFLFYFLYLRRQLGGMDGKTLVSGLLKILAAAALLGAVCWAGKTWFLQGFLDWSFPSRVLGISLVCGCAGIIYLLAAFLLKTPELDAARAKLMKR